MQNTRKTLIISVIVIIVAVAALIILFGRKKSENGGSTFLGRLFPQSETVVEQPPEIPPELLTSTETQEPSLNPATAQNLPPGTLIRLSSDNVSSLAITGTTTKYHKNTAENLGHLFERLADGSNEERRVSNFTIPKILRVVWSPDARRAVIFYNLNEEIRKILVDYTETTPKTNFLPDTISAVAFSPDSKSITFINSFEETHNIFTASSSFGNQKKILDNNIPGLEISWPAANIIALKTKSSQDDPGFLYTITASGNKFQKVVESTGLDAMWNKDGSKIMYTDFNLNLFYLNTKTGEQKGLSLKTVAEKCVFSAKSDVVYCAIPKTVSKNMNSDKWWQGKIAFTDSIAGINLSNLELVFFAQTQSDATNPVLLENDTYLLFKDRSTGELWSLKLK
ncbi:MAG: hypothetical protein AAB522_00265 [Patescibacteria group bacterium]